MSYKMRARIWMGISALLLTVVIVGGSVQFTPVQAAGTWSRDQAVIAQWFDANSLQFTQWCATNLTQTQINTIETMMFPPPTAADGLTFLDRIRQQYQESGINLTATPEGTAFRDAFVAFYQKLEADAAEE